jgi:hypothetical protein
LVSNSFQVKEAFISWTGFFNNKDDRFEKQLNEPYLKGVINRTCYSHNHEKLAVAAQ